ncbi:mitochondrial outer membrane protein porin 4-like isoform X2 [Impatiens glandulifera]|uniref:mitochondrial outer membrane protein porin 4-like isoform X2 n=1 Tax=Impatiens glandulifera TaxID=253017 RepID=UPI001FB079CB|nr:mitochondrial outer membrane protein porin 4-like isoform X2 [Impatiens glandulifera]
MGGGGGGVDGPAPFSSIGKQAKDLLMKGYNFEKKFLYLVRGSSGMMGHTTSCAMIDGTFVGHLNARYKRGCTTLVMNVDTNFNLIVDGIFPTTRTALKFTIPGNKLHVQYRHNIATINSSLILNSDPVLKFSAGFGINDIAYGGKFCFDTSSMTKWNVGIGIRRPNSLVSFIMEDNGEGNTLRASYIGHVEGIQVAAEMIHRFSELKNSFEIGCSHTLDPYSKVKTKFAYDGKVSMFYERGLKKRGKRVTISAQYDFMDLKGVLPKLGISFSMKS